MTLQLFRLFGFFVFFFFFSAQLAFAQHQTSGVEHHAFSLELAANVEQKIDTHFSFQAFALDKVNDVEVRFLDEKGWSTWQGLAREEDLPHSELLFVSSARAFAVRSPVHQEVTATVLQMKELPVQVVQNDQMVLDSGIGTSSGFRIISRQEWGADESLGTYVPSNDGDEEDGGEKDNVNICAPLERAYPGQYQVSDRYVTFDDFGRPLIWPRQYSNKIKKIVIHHTAQTLKDLNNDRRLDSRDYKLAVQAIYTYHTITNGWGDLGYHYLVDPDGNVYEGRAGGPEVIGAHVLCQNSNTVGISVMGNFEDQKISERAFAGLVNITSYLAGMYDVNPLGKSAFRGATLPNIVTHAEVGVRTKEVIGQGATACPGLDLKSSMDRLRSMVAQGGIKPDYAYEVVTAPSTITVNPLQTFEVKLRLRNSGQQSWNALRVYGKGSKDPLVTLSSFVGPGSEVDISLPYQAGMNSGLQKENLVFEFNTTKLSKSISISYRVNRPLYRYQVLQIDGHKGPVLVGEKRLVQLTLRNTSNFPWLSGGTNALQIREIRRNGSEIVALPAGTQLFLSEEVPVGGQITLSLELDAQRKVGEYETEFLPMIGRTKGLKGGKLQVSLDVELPKFVAEVKPLNSRAVVQKGFEQEVSFQLKNNSNFDWEAGMVWVQLKDGEKQLVDQEVKKGASFTFPVKVLAGYNEKKAEVSGHVGIDKLPSFVQLTSFRPSKASFSESVSARGTVKLMAEVAGVGSPPPVPGTHQVMVQLHNTSNVPWYQTGKNRMVLVLSDTADYLHRSWEKRTIAGFLDKAIVMPNEVGTFLITLDVKSLPRRTTYDEFVPMVGDKKVRLKGKIRIGIEIAGTKEKRERKADLEGSEVEVDEKEDAEPTSIPPVIDAQIPPVRVWLTDVSQPTLEVTSAGDFIVWDSTTVQIRNMKAGEVFTVREEALKDGTIFRVRAQGAPALELKNWGLPKEFGTKKYFDNTFRNVLEFRWEAAPSTPGPLQGENPSAASNGKLIVINELPLEDYMKGIAEVPETDDQPQEKRKTIAVLARSYALHYLISEYEKFPGKPYNAANSPAIFQKYLGYGFEQRAPKWQEAVRDTEGEVVMVESSQFQVPSSKKDLVLRAAYFSCTDGDRTKTPDQAGWGTNEYFQKFEAVFASVEDPLGDDPTREGLTACGHQVGLSGYGATQMAKQGKNYREIIGHYYQGVEVGKYE